MTTKTPFQQHTSSPEYSEFIALSRYARWLPEDNRREQWHETVQRYVDFFRERVPSYKKDDQFWEEIRQSIYQLDTMPSMRAIMTAGRALERDEMAGFNCAAVAIDRQRAFDETMYVLMCGTGMGFSAQGKFTNKLPEIAEEFYETDTVINVRDSKIGWAAAFRELISLLYAGQIPKWDVSKVRSEGAALKTFGGRASGPDPLEDLFRFCVNTFNRFKGKKLPRIAVLDMVCKIAEIVVVGGVRRSALLALTDLDDQYAARAKSPFIVNEYTLLDQLDGGDRKYSVIVDDAPYGERSLIVVLNDRESEQLQRAHSLNWWHVHPERALANISIAYDDTPDVGRFMREWQNLYESKAGERGIFNNAAVRAHLTRLGRRNPHQDWLCNPCSEISLRSRQVCNLSEVVIRYADTLGQLIRKVRIAAILGTFQATLTNFRYVSRKWRENCEEEALLGVSLTGIMDHPVMNGSWGANIPEGFNDVEGVTLGTLEELLEYLRNVAVDTNKEWATILRIKPATAVTCVKPSGTVSQLVDSASGIHARYGQYYIRTVRADKKDPLARMMTDAGFPVEDAIGSDKTQVFSFPVKAPEKSIFRDDRTAIQQLELWLTYQRHWCEHKPSCTVYVKEHEWMDVGAWVYGHFDELSGVSFLPHSDHVYPQAPYQEITGEEYESWVERMPPIDWSRLGEYEEEDTTIGTQEYSCSGTSCELVDIEA